MKLIFLLMQLMMGQMYKKYNGNMKIKPGYSTTITPLIFCN